ncbi:hypothetical protein GE09DRAFT_1106407 [Coniochaeta sp. 2T2.1]|nr:hypothetical protein GE09DRAFT_1106407 [Coniochaeta sp. 2T2.1]
MDFDHSSFHLTFQQPNTQLRATAPEHQVTIYGLIMSSPPGFFHLPITIRHRIYEAAGLPIRTDVAMSRQERARRGEKGFSALDLEVFTSLILVCRSMHNEVIRLFYSDNRFYIRHRVAVGDVSGRDLAPLRQLSPRALSALSFLTVRLHVSGRRYHSRWELDTLKCPGSGDEPLSSSTPQAEARLLEWQATVQHLSSHISPGALHLGFVCDVADSEMARRITSELDHFPALRQCDIRLNNDPNKEELFEIAKQAAVRALNSKAYRLFPPCPPSPFRFLDLPPEVRLHILGYTDLVTPLSTVSWELGLMHDFSRRRLLMGTCENDFEWMDGPPHTECKPPYDGCYPRDHERCDPYTCLREPQCPHQFRKCWRCPHYGCQFLKCWSRSAGGCFCRALHTAYSTLCRCWRPPTDLFLVSRLFCNDARAVFYSLNHFIVESVYWDHRLPRPPRHPASIFLRDAVPTGALGHLRSLEICSLHFDRYPFGEDIADQDWQRTVNYLRDKINPVFLKIVVDTFSHSETNWPDRNFFRALEVDEDIDLLKTSIAAFWPLNNLSLNSLQQLYVVVQHDGELGYYFRRCGQAPLATTPMIGFNHERDFRLLGTDDHGAARIKKGHWVEGIWGYIREY